MKKVVAFLLTFVLLIGALFVSISAQDTSVSNAWQDTACACGDNYGEWRLPADGVCVGGRYTRVCGGCAKVQTAKDITTKTISYNVPAIGANEGDTVLLSLYDVYFTSSKVVAAKDIVWSTEATGIEIVNNQICPAKAGTYALTATSGTSTKTVYLVVKKPTDTEYVLYYDDFNIDVNGDGKTDERVELDQTEYTAIYDASGTESYIQNGNLVLDTMVSSSAQMRVLLPSWISAFGDYKIDTRFAMNSTVNDKNANSYWFATMARVGAQNGYPLWQAAVRQGAMSHKSGIELANKSSSSSSWVINKSGKYTANLTFDQYYTLTYELSGSTATHTIDGRLNLTATGLKNTTGNVGFHLRASKVSVDSIRIVVPIDDSVHIFGDWSIIKNATCTENGTKTRACESCGFIETNDIAATGHVNFSDWETVTPATCTENGVQQRVCVDCNKVETKTIKASHTLVTQAAKAPTCTEVGWREYNICANCDYTTFAGELGPLGHYFDREIKCIAHRGYSSIAPENTLPAYILAKELGFFYAECDVAFTKDGVAVLLHDETIDRTSNGSGKVYELTFDELRQYDFGSWKNNTYTGVLIPSFEEFIALCKEIGIHPYIEIKNDANYTYTEQQVQSLVNIVKQYGMEDDCTWISFSLTYLEYVKNADDTARLGYVSSKTITQSMINSVLALKTGNNEVFLDISYNMLNENNVMLAMANGIALETWTVDNVNDIKVRPKYVSGYTSNKIIATDTLVKVAVTDPTCTTQGYTTYTCLCGATKVDDYVPTTNHTFVDGECVECGKANESTVTPTHEWETIGTEYRNGFDKVGVEIVSCLICGAIEDGKEVEALYTFVGYSVSQIGSNGIAVGYEVNGDAIAKYEAATGKTVEIGVVFAGYDNLAGKQPLDENGNVASLEVGKVIKANLRGFDYRIYDFVLTDIDDSIKDVSLVIAAYIYDGEGVEYLQENGATYTVSGISYNEVMEKVEK